MRDDFDRLFEKHMKNPKFKKEYDALESEYSIIQAFIDARKASKLTQKQLSERTGIDQADISKIETGNSNPTLQLIQRLADGMNMAVKLEFVAKQ